MLKTSLGTEGYMAPEVFNKKANYHGVPNDIFSAGVIFFIFMTGLPPFKKAIPKDPFYGQMCINRHTKFWGEHERRLKMKFSEEFKTLINAMLSYDPTHRPSIAEIYASDWLSKGKIPTDEEIKKELLRFKGLGKKTVSCVLLFTLGRDEFPVDTHVHRISIQQKWIPINYSRDDGYEYLNERIPSHLKLDLHCLLVQHGRECHRCAARGKPQFPPLDGSKLRCPLIYLMTQKKTK